MSPSDLELLLRRLLGEGLQLHPTSYILLAVVSMLTAGMGAHLGAYLRRRGENLATKADFESILKQLSLQTMEVEGIKSEIARAGWVHQRRWELTRDLYVDLLKTLEEVRQKGRWLRQAVGNYWCPNPDADKHVKTFAIHMEERGTVDKLLAAKAVSGIVLSHHVVDALDRLSGDYNFALERILVDQNQDAVVDFLRGNLDNLLGATDEVYQTVLQASQHDLLGSR